MARSYPRRSELDDLLAEVNSLYAKLDRAAERELLKTALAVIPDEPGAARDSSLAAAREATERLVRGQLAFCLKAAIAYHRYHTHFPVSDAYQCAKQTVVKCIRTYRLEQTTKLNTIVYRVIPRELRRWESKYWPGYAMTRRFRDCPDVAEIVEAAPAVFPIETAASGAWEPHAREDGTEARRAFDAREEAELILAKMSPEHAELIRLRYGFDGRGERGRAALAKAKQWSQQRTNQEFTAALASARSVAGVDAGGRQRRATRKVFA